MVTRTHKRGLAVFIDQWQSSRAATVIFAGPIRLQPPAASAIARESRSGAIRPASTLETRQVFRRHIDASHAGIFFDVANDVGQLEGQAQIFRQRFRCRIAISEYTNANQSHD